MKQWILCGVMAVMLASCGGKKESKERDTILPENDPFEMTADPTHEVPDSVDSFYSDDLKAHRILGRVLDRSEISANAEMIYPEITRPLTFDTLGNLLNKASEVKAIKDDSGRYSKFIQEDGEGTKWVLSYEELNETGYPVKSVIEETGPQGSAHTDITYENYRYDRHGNWIVRDVEATRVFTDAQSGEKYTNTRSWKEVCTYRYKQ